jgi:hypothetical protein
VRVAFAAVGLGALALVAATVAATWMGTRRQQRRLAADLERLIHAGEAAAAPSTVGVSPRADLPSPVARYLRLALPAPTTIREVRIAQVGTLRTDPASDRWMPFEAEHLVIPAAPGFLWNARVHVAPLLHVRVRDELVDGTGSGQVSLLSAFPVNSAAGGPAMNSGSLHRFLAEAVWYPTALLPGPNLQWTGIDDTRALATMTDRGTTVSLEFRFAANGEVAGIYTPGRWGSFSDGFKQVPWEGHFRHYREHHGVLVPTEGDVGWYVDGEWRPVWRGTMLDYQVRTGD